MSSPQTRNSSRSVVADLVIHSIEVGLKPGAEGFCYATRYGRRLEDKILIAFHQACDQGDGEVAEELVRVLATMLASSLRRRAQHASAVRRERGNEGRVPARGVAAVSNWPAGATVQSLA